MRCKVCGRPLKNIKSINKGMGPGCEHKIKIQNINVLTLNDFFEVDK